MEEKDINNMLMEIKLNPITEISTLEYDRYEKFSLSEVSTSGMGLVPVCDTISKIVKKFRKLVLNYIKQLYQMDVN